MGAAIAAGVVDLLSFWPGSRELLADDCDVDLVSLWSCGFLLAEEESSFARVGFFRTWPGWLCLVEKLPFATGSSQYAQYRNLTPRFLHTT